MMRRPRIAFVNDTSLTEPHFGCQLVCQAFREQFARVGLDLHLSLHRQFSLDGAGSTLDDVDLVVINGEGSLHHNKHRQLLDLPDRFPTVLMNCVYEANDPHPGLRKFLYISARESSSAAAIHSQGANCVIVPDALFASSQLHSFQKPAPSHDFGETDNVRRHYLRLGPLKIRGKIGFSTRFPTPAGYLAKLSSYRRLCIGRFHAAVAASVLEIPFSTWDSNTWKTRAMMKDMGVPQLHFETRQQAIAGAPREFAPEIRQFTREARQRIEASFDHIARLARQQAGLE